MTQPPFPTPDQLGQQKAASASDETDRLRALVRKAFAEQNPGGSSYSVKADGFGRVAVDTVFAELRAAGWEPRRGDQRDLRGEFFIDRKRR
jgi:hypothetical protein